MRRIYGVIGLLVVLGAALLLGAAVASASGVQEAPASQDITCEREVQHPHHSSHVPGTINVVATIECSSAVPELDLKVTLQRQQCFYFICWWDNVGPTGGEPRYGARTTRANSAIDCQTGSYRGYSQDKIVWPDGTEETGWGYSVEQSLTC